MLDSNNTNVTPTRDDEDTAIYETADLRPKLRIHQILTKNHKPRAQIGAGFQIPIATNMTQLYFRMHGNNITPLPAELDDTGDIRPKCRFQQILTKNLQPRVQIGAGIQHYQDDPNS